MEKNFIKVRSIKDITVSIILAAAGGVMVALPTADSVNVAGFFLMFAGILLFFLLKSAYKDEAGVKYSKKERYFSQENRPELIEKISSNPNGINLTDEDKGNAVRLDIYHSKESGKAYLQLFEYIPYKYEPCSKQLEYDLDAISNIR